MKISIWWPGKTKEPMASLVEDYLHRVKRIHDVGVKPFELKKGLRPEQQKLRESSMMLKQIRNTDRVFLLDEKGVNYTSPKFATFLQKQLMIGRHLIFIIGGPYGFSQELYHRSDGLISLSKMTFTHDMSRIILLEQLYRAFTIHQNLPYHHY